VLFTVQVQLLERLRDDCDVLISMLIAREGEVRTVSARSVERIVRLLRQPRLLFDVADGWPPLEDVEKAMGLTSVIVGELASELDHMSASDSQSHYSYGTAYQAAIASLKYRYAEVALWQLRQWLDRRIVAETTAPARDAFVEAAPTSGHVAKPPPLRLLDDGPSLGFRPVGNSRVSLTDATLLERANDEHEATLQAVRKHLAVRGVECRQSSLIDLACVLNGAPLIVEAKSISRDNEIEQVRAAYAQLHDYRFRYRDEEPFVGRDIGLWVALSEVPRENWTSRFLSSVGIRLVWLGENRALAGPNLCFLGT
jgi:hypothetical protein